MNAKRVKNQANALQSTGPRTREGKAVSSKNAIRHGAYSEVLIVLGEDPKAFEALHRSMMESIGPVGPLEERLVDRLVSLLWRLERAARAEREGFKANLEAAFRSLENDRALFGGALKGVLSPSAPEFAESEPTHVAFTWGRAGEGLERLLRYEGQLERSVFRTLHELERVQAHREGQAVSLPMVLDVSIDTLGK